MSKKRKKPDYLIFIDTNIFLDFYRVRSGKLSLKYLDLIAKYSSKIITTSQVQMEFLKNRQVVLLDSMKQLKGTATVDLPVPIILTQAQSVEQINKSKKEIGAHHKKLRDKIDKIFKNPNGNDPVFKAVQALFKTKSNFILDRENNERLAIRELAKKRFSLGYPPRKEKDTSFGDAINWEWIIRCAKDSGKNIVIVTRDSDYGVTYSEEMFINDWLLQEFKQRVGARRKLVLTDKLFQAFEFLSVTVAKGLVKEEIKFLELGAGQFKASGGDVKFTITRTPPKDGNAPNPNGSIQNDSGSTNFGALDITL